MTINWKSIIAAAIAGGALGLLMGIPFAPLTCCLCLIFWLVPIGLGYLAAEWDQVTKGESVKGLMSGAIAGGVSGIMYGLASMFMDILLVVTGLADKAMESTLNWLDRTGIDYDTSLLQGGSSIGEVLLGGTICCGFAVVFFAVLGALGGLLKALTAKEG